MDCALYGPRTGSSISGTIAYALRIEGYVLAFILQFSAKSGPEKSAGMRINVLHLHPRQRHLRKGSRVSLWSIDKSESSPMTCEQAEQWFAVSTKIRCKGDVKIEADISATPEGSRCGSLVTKSHSPKGGSGELGMEAACRDYYTVSDVPREIRRLCANKGCAYPVSLSRVSLPVHPPRKKVLRSVTLRIVNLTATSLKLPPNSVAHMNLNLSEGYWYTLPAEYIMSGEASECMAYCDGLFRGVSGSLCYEFIPPHLGGAALSLRVVWIHPNMGGFQCDFGINVANTAVEPWLCKLQQQKVRRRFKVEVHYTTLNERVVYVHVIDRCHLPRVEIIRAFLLPASAGANQSAYNQHANRVVNNWETRARNFPVEDDDDDSSSDGIFLEPSQNPHLLQEYFTKQVDCTAELVSHVNKRNLKQHNISTEEARLQKLIPNACVDLSEGFPVRNFIASINLSGRSLTGMSCLLLSWRIGPEVFTRLFTADDRILLSNSEATGSGDPLMCFTGLSLPRLPTYPYGSFPVRLMYPRLRPRPLTNTDVLSLCVAALRFMSEALLPHMGEVLEPTFGPSGKSWVSRSEVPARMRWTDPVDAQNAVETLDAEGVGFLLSKHQKDHFSEWFSSEELSDYPSTLKQVANLWASQDLALITPDLVGKFIVGSVRLFILLDPVVSYRDMYDGSCRIYLLGIVSAHSAVC
ncbi:MAG: uncharacterized protein KVP18_003528 [Porospora cf. gigantea A]|uniref:uncharacterized protein n=1 Tax=Porospora cf. gigantea A TaxID=2853593 RepID=UPI0035599EDB|nr:MAG: hypothetical protein KVP18_003528 [Porospora cf. gigantea A]